MYTEVCMCMRIWLESIPPNDALRQAYGQAPSREVAVMTQGLFSASMCNDDYDKAIDCCNTIIAYALSGGQDATWTWKYMHHAAALYALKGRHGDARRVMEEALVWIPRWIGYVLKWNWMTCYSTHGCLYV